MPMAHVECMTRVETQEWLHHFTEVDKKNKEASKKGKTPRKTGRTAFGGGRKKK